MIRRPITLLLLPMLAAGLALSGCSEDDPATDGAATGSPGPSTSATTTTATTNPATVVTTSLAPDGAADCAEMDAISGEISARFTDGVGVEEGAVLDVEQIEAVRELGTRFAEVEIDDDGLAELRDRIVAATETVLLSGEAGTPLTADVAGGLTGALFEMGSLCFTAE